MDSQSIVQLATPKALSAIHIIRFSGENCVEFIKAHLKAPNTNSSTLKSPRRACHLSFVDGTRTIDKLIAIYFKAPYSYTGEDMLELQCHGSLAIVDEILRITIRGSFRLAKPGEFTYRAFINGKINLEESEAIDTLIKSQSSRQRDNALSILEKKASLKFEVIENDILNILAELTSVIEFPEEDIPEIEIAQDQRYANYLKKCQNIEKHFQTIYKNYLTGKRIEDGIKVVLVGSPNAGKSTLMNLLLRENRSIVSPIKGTTRDYIRETFNLDGFPLKLIDTAGIHPTQESIEQMGIEKSKQLIQEANIIIWIISAEEVANPTQTLEELLNFKKTIEATTNPELTYLVYLNKIDLLPTEEQKSTVDFLSKHLTPINHVISLIDEKYRELIEKDIKEIIEKQNLSEENNLALLNERQAIISKKVISQIQLINQKLKQFESEEIILEDFQAIANLLKEINIDLQHENIFDQLFSRFCLGK